MSFTVFSARSIANDLESAVGEEAFYFYMRKIIEQKLCEKYVDDVNGEECKFDGLLQFMQHKDGLGIKDLPLFEKCLGVVASSFHKMAQNAHWLKSVIQSERAKRSQGREAKTGRMLKKPAHDIVMDGQGNSRDYLLRRIARESPALLSEIGKDKRLKSARAAAIEAGIITPLPSLQLKDPAPTARKLLEKQGPDWCLQLMEELSELVL